jgi:hypothetical protein
MPAVRDVDYFLKQLDRCRGRELSATLVRRVPWTALHASADFLFVSGKPNRYNLAGTGSIYFAADDLTAQWEYEDGIAGPLALLQPVVVFRAKVRLKKRPALDLLDHDTRRTLGLTSADLFVDWVKNPPVATQWLGEAVQGLRRDSLSLPRHKEAASPGRQCGRLSQLRCGARLGGNSGPKWRPSAVALAARPTDSGSDALLPP